MLAWVGDPVQEYIFAMGQDLAEVTVRLGPERMQGPGVRHRFHRCPRVAVDCTAPRIAVKDFARSSVYGQELDRLCSKLGSTVYSSAVRCI